MIAKIVLGITLVVTVDYILIILRLQDIISKIDKLEEKINDLRGEK